MLRYVQNEKRSILCGYNTSVVIIRPTDNNEKNNKIKFMFHIIILPSTVDVRCGILPQESRLGRKRVTLIIYETIIVLNTYGCAYIYASNNIITMVYTEENRNS